MNLKIGRTIILFLQVLLVVQISLGQTKIKYEKFLDDVKKGVVTDAERLKEEFKIDSYDRWSALQRNGGFSLIF